MQRVAHLRYITFRGGALFLSVESVALSWRRELGKGGPAPRNPRLYLRGASPPANSMALAMDEAEIDDSLIEDILDLLNDALGG